MPPLSSDIDSPPDFTGGPPAHSGTREIRSLPLSPIRVYLVKEQFDVIWIMLIEDRIPSRTFAFIIEQDRVMNGTITVSATVRTCSFPDYFALIISRAKYVIQDHSDKMAYTMPNVKIY
jgi:hypothetical protein